MRIVQCFTNFHQWLQNLPLGEIPTDFFLLFDQMAKVSVGAELHHYGEEFVLSVVETLLGLDNVWVMQLV